MSNELKALLFTGLLLFTLGSILLYNPLTFLGIVFVFGVIIFVSVIYNWILILLENKRN